MVGLAMADTVITYLARLDQYVQRRSNIRRGRMAAVVMAGRLLGVMNRGVTAIMTAIPAEATAEDIQAEAMVGLMVEATTVAADLLHRTAVMAEALTAAEVDTAPAVAVATAVVADTGNFSLELETPPTGGVFYAERILGWPSFD